MTPATTLAIIGDTHIPGRATDLPPSCWEHIVASDGVIHTGDVVAGDLLGRLAATRPLHVVRGNNDTALGELPEALRLTVAGVDIGVVHDSGSATGRRRRLGARFPGARVIVFGHSHIPLLDDDGALMLLNPGSPTDRRRMPTFTMALLHLGDGDVAAEIVDLGRERAR